MQWYRLHVSSSINTSRNCRRDRRGGVRWAPPPGHPGSRRRTALGSASPGLLCFPTTPYGLRRGERAVAALATEALAVLHLCLDGVARHRAHALAAGMSSTVTGIHGACVGRVLA